jgi:hypothetical protein
VGYFGRRFQKKIATMLHLRSFLTLALLLHSGLAFTQTSFLVNPPSLSTSSMKIGSSTQLSMALAMPPSPRPLFRKGKWYEETCGLAQRKVYKDDFRWLSNDDNENVSDARPFYGIQSAPLILPTALTRRGGSSRSKRDRLRGVAQWAWKGIRRQ